MYLPIERKAKDFYLYTNNWMSGPGYYTVEAFGTDIIKGFEGDYLYFPETQDIFKIEEVSIQNVTTGIREKQVVLSKVVGVMRLAFLALVE